MIRDICKDELFLARKAAPALPEDLPIAQDLLETLIAHKDGCVGMAANMIGVAKRFFAFGGVGGYLVVLWGVVLVLWSLCFMEQQKKIVEIGFLCTQRK